MNNEPITDLIARISTPEPWLLDLSGLSRGIDNYHIDVRISPRFNSDLRKLITALLDSASNSNSKTQDNTRYLEAIQRSYRDMMTALIHRVQTDLDVNEVQVLEFAVIKQVLEAVRQQLDMLIEDVKTKAGELRKIASTEAFTANQRLFQLQKNYDAILFRINRQIFTQLQRVEMRNLRHFRSKHLPASSYEATDVLFNPMLFTSDLSAVSFLSERYRLWGTDEDDGGFTALNSGIEALLQKSFQELEITPFFPDTGRVSPELYDTLGGLLQTQKFMGIAEDQKREIRESFCWFDSPANVGLLFDLDKHATLLQDTRREQGFKAWWHLRKQTRRARKALLRIAKHLEKSNLLALLVASNFAARLWSSSLGEQLDVKSLTQYLSGQINLKKLQERVAGKRPLSDAQIQQFEETLEEVTRHLDEKRLEAVSGILRDISRFRENMKGYRFAHRAFNRLHILTAQEDITLSSNAGTLYSLLSSQEQQDPDRVIVHHAVMKADVRGSTTVTEELQNRNLNPASYFSLRFFSPINKILALYGANKVFIEGDALILSFLEHEKDPQNWFSVARACGLARAILGIVQANNRYSTQMELPHLELGIGICYSDKPPFYLYDEDRPIMISPAIGQADRLSSCSWRLRESMKNSLFNVDVLRLADDDSEKGEKGQKFIRYNVNGILLDHAAFAKLESEIKLRRLTARVNNEPITLLTGKYPDTEGKSHDLLLREQRIGLWREDHVVPDSRDGEYFYEVVTNQQLQAQINRQA